MQGRREEEVARQRGQAREVPSLSLEGGKKERHLCVTPCAESLQHSMHSVRILEWSPV